MSAFLEHWSRGSSGYGEAAHVSTEKVNPKFLIPSSTSSRSWLTKRIEKLRK